VLAVGFFVACGGRGDGEQKIDGTMIAPSTTACAQLAEQSIVDEFGELPRIRRYEYLTDEFKLFFPRLDEVATFDGFPQQAIKDPRFDDLYAELSGSHVYVLPDLRQAYYSRLEECLQRPVYQLSAGEWQRASCLLRAIFEAEGSWGKGSLGYTQAFLEYARQQGATHADHHQLESAYRELTGSSPGTSDGALRAYRAKAATC
jgi:hypothetical protein